MPRQPLRAYCLGMSEHALAGASGEHPGEAHGTDQMPGLPPVAPGLQWTGLDSIRHKRAGTFAVARFTGLFWMSLDY